MVNNDKNTQVTHLPNGWIQLDSTDYTVYIKSFVVDGKAITVYLDGWSITPISLSHYHTDDLVLNDWHDLHHHTYYALEDMWDLSPLRDKLPLYVFHDVENAHNTFFEE